MTSDSVVNTVLKAGLPVLCIETIGHEEPTCDYVSAPEGCWLNTIMSHIFNLNLYGTRSFHYCARYEEEKNDSFPAAIDVTEENYLLCQQCGIVESEE